MNSTRVLVIAEAGVNHNGDLGMARQLVDAAASAGADYVKFQTFKASNLVTRDAAKASYQKAKTDSNESQFEMLQRLELSHSDHVTLIEHCKDVGIRFFSTAFDLSSVSMLDELGIDILKIPSGEITNTPYLRRIAEMGKPVILSTGMATLAEIETAIDIIEKAGTKRERVTVLHCNTQYPTPMEDVNLRAMRTIQSAFKVNVGYSDHTLGIEVAVAAVALGATVIEKHFTLDQSLPGPDHAASLTPSSLQAMVSSIRNIERALGDGVKRPSPSEKPNRSIARKSIVAATPINRGDTFTEANITVKRPGNGISPFLWDQLIGRTASRDYHADELIQW